jgi:hypothetical protein
VERIELSSMRELRRIRGIWYDVTLALWPEPGYPPYVIAKRQLSSKELRRNGLENQSDDEG